jgi:aryl-alcohol dehydrogenase-like predicted oxidoreductase
LNKLSIPNSTIKISQICYGCARLLGGIEKRHSEKLIETALRLGITHFDTAPFYGTEDLIGQILSNTKEITITTKIGLPFRNINNIKNNLLRPIYRYTIKNSLSNSLNIFGENVKHHLQRKIRNEIKPLKILTKDIVLKELEASLKRLKRDKVDVYLIHEPEQYMINDDLTRIFETLKLQGVIGAYGLAYGGAPNLKLNWGSIEQCQYSKDVILPDNPDLFRIYHGVLRNKNNRNALPINGTDAEINIQSVLRKNKTSVLFSSNSINHIKNIIDVI